jgi:hypothetical protein
LLFAPVDAAFALKEYKVYIDDIEVFSLLRAFVIGPLSTLLVHMWRIAYSQYKSPNDSSIITCSLERIDFPSQAALSAYLRKEVHLRALSNVAKTQKPGSETQVLVASWEPELIDCRETVAKRWFGPRVNRAVVKFIRSTPIGLLLALLILGPFLTVLAVFDMLPVIWSTASFTALPHIACIYLRMNWRLVCLSLEGFITRYIIVMNFLMFAGLGLGCADFRAIAIVVWFPLWTSFVFIEALPRGLRKKAPLFVAAGVVVGLCILCAVYLRSIPRWNSFKVPLPGRTKNVVLADIVVKTGVSSTLPFSVWAMVSCYRDVNRCFFVRTTYKLDFISESTVEARAALRKDLARTILNKVMLKSMGASSGLDKLLKRAAETKIHPLKVIEE